MEYLVTQEERALWPQFLAVAATLVPQSTPDGYRPRDWVQVYELAEALLLDWRKRGGG